MIIKSKIKNYQLEFIDRALGKKDLLKKDNINQKLFYLIDENVYKIYQRGLESFVGENKFIIVSATEEAKSFHSLPEVYRKIINSGFKRNDILVTFGGGVLQDISGFIASTIYRGVKWIFFPTTLLAQADSCIGSKTSINFDNSKNLIGTFYPPDLIYIDVDFCQTLAPEFFNSGLGEIIKFHLMSDDKGYDLLKEYLASSDLRESPYFRPIIQSTLEIKKSYFEGDEFDTGRRNLLNYGHCFGHALESASNFAIPHGEAVIVGMGFANLLSSKRGLMTQEKYDEFEKIFQKHYPRFDLSKISVDTLINYLKRDKKRVGQDLTMILSKDIGQQLKADDIKESEIKDTYDDFLKNYPIK